MAAPIRILIINPNTSKHMTEALKPVVESLNFPSDIKFTFFTSPSPGIASINSPKDASRSAEFCLPKLIPLLDHHDAFLVACYSQHPLVPQLKNEYAERGASTSVERKYVTGIFEASVTASLALVPDDAGFGIVSTGKIWESALQTAVDEFLGAKGSTRFYGCETTGLNASELHDLPAEEVRVKMMDATKRLLRRGMTETAGQGSKVKAICLGCAGMVGLDSAVRSACVEELGEEAGMQVYIVDGVKAGVGALYGLLKAMGQYW
ncbi:Protein dcg1 [Elasticomyces elasticus]|uniref:Dal80p-controlled protein n=1 Tax=Exophiala sideris TaxID=1016849 RepID=A0ABR0JBM5_9EURO|nr:Protein dcg1 [Elasticomyces elasticus]KAK5022807.1 dal80p-controlled protein [Exophiala sideris]KAK5026709.1 Protein dcg1 [Exophiala sideris]KAK5059434.1 dal80p-controlled protein [Exophiala sideris]KAK5177422.1 dal80p-controlled protein [Eurotiomycetes sp. CCFEE 6388]